MYGHIFSISLAGLISRLSHLKLHSKSPWVSYNYYFTLLSSASNLLIVPADVSAFGLLGTLLDPFPLNKRTPFSGCTRTGETTGLSLEQPPRLPPQ